MDVSIIVINYNTKSLTLACLQTIYAQTTDITFEVIVVDNASHDGSAEAIRGSFPQARLMVMDRNLGFGAANNVAAAGARGRWLLLLNSDTLVLDRAVSRLVRFGDARHHVDIVGASTWFPDGSLNPTSCWNRSTLWSMTCFGLGLSAFSPWISCFDTETMRHWKRDTVREVDIVSGCCLLIRRGLWNNLDGFDPSFFMYGEDFDLCLRARARGATCMLCPDARIIHYGGSSAVNRADQLISKLRARRSLILKHWSAPTKRLGLALARQQVLTRMIVFTMLSRLNRRFNDRRHLWTAAWREEKS